MPTPPTPQKAVTILGVRRDPDGTFVVVDSTQREHFAGDEHGLGKLVGKLCDDPELPRSTTEGPERNAVVEAAGKIARRLVHDPVQRQAIDFLEPLAHLASNEIAKRAEQRPRRRRGARASRG